MPITHVPHLMTALNGPLLDLERQFLAQQTAIEVWLRKAFQQTPPPFYCSVDVRNAGYKMATVDTNLFPAGFNNLPAEALPLAVHAAQNAMLNTCPITDGVIILAESHTRNPFYFQHLAALSKLLQLAGYQVKLASLALSESTAFAAGEETLWIHPLQRHEDCLSADGYAPCAVLLNNDLSEGLPEILQGVSQVLTPHVGLGWYQRQKSNHFDIYQGIVQEFSQQFQLDPWVICPKHRVVDDVDFDTRAGEDALVAAVENLLQEISENYQQQGINQQPFVVIKNDSGTYGMSVISAKSVDEVINLNRKQRKKLAAAKGGAKVRRLIVQEGIYAMETIQGAVAEPVIYMMDRHIVGGFYRVHTDKTATDNLNAPGMHFTPLPFADACNLPDHNLDPDATPNRFYAYGVVARLALLAAAREISQLQPPVSPS